jgi:hypothetical protein
MRLMSTPSTDVVERSRASQRAQHIADAAAQAAAAAAREAAKARPERREPWPVLAPGTLVKAGISWLASHLLVVIHDPGPAGRRDRSVEIGRREPQRASERYSVRRHNLVPAAELTRHLRQDELTVAKLGGVPLATRSDPDPEPAPAKAHKPTTRKERK